MSEYKEFHVSYTMVDGEVFEWTYGCKSREALAKIIYKELGEACFHLGERPIVILVSANVRNVDIVEKL